MTKKDYLTLDNGQKIRVQLNMNALGSFTTLTGKELFDLTGKTDMNLLRTIAWCAACEGEACDGREFKLSEIEFGRLVNFAGILEFSKILTKQISSSEQKKSKPQKETTKK